MSVPSPGLLWAPPFCVGADGPSARDSPCFLQIGLDTGYWTAINHFFIWGSLAVYFAILFAMHSNGLFDMFPDQFRFVGESLSLLVCGWVPAAPARAAEGPHLFGLLVGGLPAHCGCLLTPPCVLHGAGGGWG